MNIKLVLEYEGTGYHGWQAQSGAPTIEAELRARGPYSLRVSARHGDATRTIFDGVYTTAIACEDELERVLVWQRPDGAICVRAQSEAGVTPASP